MSQFCFDIFPITLKPLLRPARLPACKYTVLHSSSSLRAYQHSPGMFYDTWVNNYTIISNVTKIISQLYKQWPHFQWFCSVLNTTLKPYNWHTLLCRFNISSENLSKMTMKKSVKSMHNFINKARDASQVSHFLGNTNCSGNKIKDIKI